MTEQLADLAVRPTAEQILGSIPHNGVKEILAAAERRQRQMNSELDDIESDEDLSLEGKQRRAQRAIDRHAEEIAQTYRDARAKVEASAETSYKFSLPFPGTKTFAQARIADSTEELAVQGSANEIAARIAGKGLQEVTKERSKNPRDRGIRQANDRRLEALRSEFDAAMSAGGVEGRIRALALARVCEGMGMPLDDVVGHHRTQSHLNALADSRRFEDALRVIPSGKHGTRNPYAGNTRRRGLSGVGTYASANKVMTGGRPRLFQKKRRPAWK
jgi:hypothetical protein